jgi:hypothetical protein
LTPSAPAAYTELAAPPRPDTSSPDRSQADERPAPPAEAPFMASRLDDDRADDADRSLAAAAAAAGAADVAAAEGEDGGRRVAERAYYLYLSRRDQDGDALSDWLEAERQIQDEARSGLQSY